MNEFDQELARRLALVRAQGLYRRLRFLACAQSPRVQISGQTLLNFSSNDYLGLANEPALKEVAVRAVERYGAGAGASRLISGSLPPHQELEEALAAFKGAEAALSFSTGYAAALGTICALLGKDDIVVIDKLVHACIVDAARLSSAKLRVFPHNDLNDLEEMLKWADCKRQSANSTAAGHGLAEVRRPRVLVVTESLFSMDGDRAPLKEIVELKDKYGAWLMVDEAHATGVYGVHRRGLVEAAGVSERIEVQMGTLGKAVGASGGYICGSRMLIDYLINRARSFIFSTAPVPASAAAAAAGVRFIQSSQGKQRCQILWQRVAELESFHLSGCQRRAEETSLRSAIIPILIGDEAKAVVAADALRNRGIFIPAIRYPTVARSAARLRLTLTAAHTSGDIHELVTALQTLQSEIENQPSKIVDAPSH
jgi:8-amino-7-oxononanoate synthase